MGREAAVLPLRPSQNRRDERARRARDMKNHDIPDMLRASPRARHGIHKADLIVDPPPFRETSQNAPSTFPAPPMKIRIQCADTLSAAAKIADRPFATKRTTSSIKDRTENNTNVTILNMASQSRPGGGFLDGANSQEEFLCARTTLYPSLWDSFYRLPEVSGIHTPDVLVFRDNLPEANELNKRDRFFVDVISAGMLRYADARAEGCSCGVSYCDRHRELVVRKMKAVLRIAQMKGVERLILGAWGCGSYGNPVKEIAKLWRKVIAGASRQRRPNIERWDSIREIIFAIPDRTMVREFEAAFVDVLASDEPVFDSGKIEVEPPADERDEISERLSKIAETELQLEQVQNPRARARLRDVLAVLQRDLAQGLAAKASRDEDMTPDSDHDEDDYVVAGFPSDGEESGGFYHYDENDVASDSSAGTPGTNTSEIYEFHTTAPYPPPSPTRSPLEPIYPPLAAALAPSPRFDPQTGWFAGSMDQLSALLRGGVVDGPTSPTNATELPPPAATQAGLSEAKSRSCSVVAAAGSDAPPQPRKTSAVVRPDSSGGLEIDEFTLREYLVRYEGTDVVDD